MLVPFLLQKFMRIINILGGRFYDEYEFSNSNPFL